MSAFLDTENTAWNALDTSHGELSGRRWGAASERVRQDNLSALLMQGPAPKHSLYSQQATQYRHCELWVTDWKVRICVIRGLFMINNDFTDTLKVNSTYSC